MDCKITKKMIDAYLSSHKITQGETDEEIEYIKESAKNNLFNDIRKEIVNLEKTKIIIEASDECEKIKKETKVECERMKQDAHIEIEKKEQERRIKEIKVLMFDGFIIAFLVGLIVNQTTDLLNVTKGDNSINVGLTLGWICVLGIGALIVYNMKFLNDIANIVKKKFGKHQN